MSDIWRRPPLANPDSRRQRGGTTGMPQATTHRLRPPRPRCSRHERSPPRTERDPLATPPSAAPVTESAPDTDEPAADAFRRPSPHLPIKVLRRPVESALDAPVRVVDEPVDGLAGVLPGPQAHLEGV